MTKCVVTLILKTFETLKNNAGKSLKPRKIIPLSPATTEGIALIQLIGENGDLGFKGASTHRQKGAIWHPIPG